jgi:hypothetical protein
MGILDSLTFAETSKKPVGKIVAPIVKAKTKFMEGLVEQRRFARLLTSGDELPKRTRLMFWTFFGSCRFLPKLGFDAVIINKDQPEIVCSDLEEVARVCDLLIEATKAGELDDAIRETIKTRPLRGRALAQAKMVAEPPFDEVAEEAEPEPVKVAPARKRMAKA